MPTSTATPTRPASSAAPPAANPSQPTDVRRELDALFEPKDDAAGKLRRAFRWINEETAPLVSSLYVDFGKSKPVSLLHKEKAVPNLLAIQIRQQLFDRMLDEIRERGTAKTSLETIDGNLLAVLAVPVYAKTETDEVQSDEPEANAGADPSESSGQTSKESPQRSDVIGAVVTASPVPANGMGVLMDRLRWMHTVVHSAVQAGRIRDAESNQPKTVPKLDAISQLTASLSLGSHHRLAIELVNQIAGSMNFDQVALGLVHGVKVELLAISGTPVVKHNMPGVIQIRQAMLECLDNQLAVYCPEVPGVDSNAASVIHERWSQSIGGNHVASIPLMSGDKVDGVLSLSCSREQPLKQRQVDTLVEQVKPLGAALRVTHQASRGPLARLLDQVMRYLDESVRRPLRWIALAGLLAATYWFVACESVYRPACRAQLQSSQAHFIASPFDGVLKEVLVKEGHRIRQGDVILKMDTRELELKRSLLLSEIREIGVQLSNTLHDRDPTAMAVAQAHQEVMKQKLAAVDDQIQRSTLTAPMSGLVARCVLPRQVGQPFRFGDEMVEIIGTDSWQVQIQIPDSVAAEIEVGQTGSFTPIGRPDESFAITVDSVSGQAQVMHDQNVFLADALLDSGGPWMRSGMEGVARIQSHTRPNYWIWFHELWNW
ncbi:MAG: HlyD family efflux transporter periplasmic adaptor subunit, partial [Planctomycetota bacterium]